MRRLFGLTIASMLVSAVPALAADKPGVSSALPGVQAPAPGTTSRLPATTPVAPVAPGAPATSGVAAAIATPLKCSVVVEKMKGSAWGGGGTYRSYKVTNSLGGRQPLPVGARIRWAAPGGLSGYGGEHVLVAALPPGQSVEVGISDNPTPKVDPKEAMKGNTSTSPTCDAKLLP